MSLEVETVDEMSAVVCAPEEIDVQAHRLRVRLVARLGPLILTEPTVYVSTDLRDGYWLASRLGVLERVRRLLQGAAPDDRLVVAAARAVNPVGRTKGQG